MRDFFRNIYLFSTLFFLALITDILIKLNSEILAYRLISKSSVIVLLLIYYLINNKEHIKQKRIFTICALLFFWIGDIFIIKYTQEPYFIFSLFSYIIGKTFYIFRFSNKRDFSISKLFPFLAPFFLYMVWVFVLIHKNLDDYFFIILLYFFVAITTIIFAYLRKNEVNPLSYSCVLIGIVFSALSDSITGLEAFYDQDIAYSLVTTMLFYGISQYFIVVGLVKETNFGKRMYSSR
ncbi:lysoplasmalogenase [Flavivirga eckloniae]|uniref:Lysoplasmalogenase n=1 Tax=Flavivirga eckloniae TaxID=1803846 RepID=A0A2K9PUQ8_9FLAO|nr:lysoplasmalogenase [Flavivirga eckloniae]AUP80806.1 hypothetical protein C1H87_19655 [Flavivirga eckloniae]